MEGLKQALAEGGGLVADDTALKTALSSVADQEVPAEILRMASTKQAAEAQERSSNAAAMVPIVRQQYAVLKVAQQHQTIDAPALQNATDEDRLEAAVLYAKTILRATKIVNAGRHSSDRVKQSAYDSATNIVQDHNALSKHNLHSSKPAAVLGTVQRLSNGITTLMELSQTKDDKTDSPGDPKTAALKAIARDAQNPKWALVGDGSLQMQWDYSDTTPAIVDIDSQLEALKWHKDCLRLALFQMSKVSVRSTDYYEPDRGNEYVAEVQKWYGIEKGFQGYIAMKQIRGKAFSEEEAGLFLQRIEDAKKNFTQEEAGLFLSRSNRAFHEVQEKSKKSGSEQMPAQFIQNTIDDKMQTRHQLKEASSTSKNSVRVAYDRARFMGASASRRTKALSATLQQEPERKRILTSVVTAFDDSKFGHGKPIGDEITRLKNALQRALNGEQLSGSDAAAASHQAVIQKASALANKLTEYSNTTVTSGKVFRTIGSATRNRAQARSLAGQINLILSGPTSVEQRRHSSIAAAHRPSDQSSSASTGPG